jgi:hypothetical protein
MSHVLDAHRTFVSLGAVKGVERAEQLAEHVGTPITGGVGQ